MQSSNGDDPNAGVRASDGHAHANDGRASDACARDDGDDRDHDGVAR